MITIIIIVKNDRRIERLLESLKHIQKPEKVEVLVIDASNSKLDDIKNKFKYVNWIRFENIHNKKTTIPDQRNIGLNKAKGDIIAFIDSDCLPTKNWLVELIKPIRKDNEDIVAGYVKLKDKNSIHNIETEKLSNSIYIDECPTMNVAFSINVFNKIGIFDENFEFGSDVDLVWRARKHLFKIRFNKNAIIYHDLGDTKNDIRRMYVYGKARMRLYKKHKYKWRFLIGNELLYTLYPLYFIFLPLTLIFYLYPALIMIPLVRYRNRKPFNVILKKTMYGIGILRELFIFNYYDLKYKD